MNIMSSNISYAFTLKKNCKASERETMQESAYYDFINMLDTRFDLKDHYYERDDKNRLHVHGIVEMPKTQKYTELKETGMSVKFKKIYNLKGWTDYIKKQQEYDYVPGSQKMNNSPSNCKLQDSLRKILFPPSFTGLPSEKRFTILHDSDTKKITTKEVDSPIDVPDDNYSIPTKKLF